jgi:ketosteroid isomerase-like protein
MRQFERGWVDAFSDAETEIVNLHGEDDFAVVEFVARGTHDGPLASPGGEIPSTGRRIETRFCEVYEIQDGKLVRGRIYFDLATIMGQLGLMPAPEEAEM